MTQPMDDQTTVFPAALEGLQHGSREVFELWTCAGQAYVDYLLSLGRVRGLGDLLDANVAAALNAVELCEQAACAMQRRHGVTIPTLNDA